MNSLQQWRRSIIGSFKKDLNSDEDGTVLKITGCWRLIMKILMTTIILVSFAVTFPLLLYADAQYIIQNGVIGIGGGAMTGDNFRMFGTAGQPMVGDMGSSLYTCGAGFVSLYEEFEPPSLVDRITLPDQYKLYGNFPNPFNPSTEISYEVPKECHVRLRIYSLSGQLIDTLMDETVGAGSHTVKWSPDGLATGLYLYSLEAGNKRLMNKMLLLK